MIRRAHIQHLQVNCLTIRKIVRNSIKEHDAFNKYFYIDHMKIEAWWKTNRQSYFWVLNARLYQPKPTLVWSQN